MKKEQRLPVKSGEHLPVEFYNQFQNYEALLKYCTSVQKSVTCPKDFTTPEDVASVWLASKELDIPFHTMGLSHMYLVKGKLAMDSHICRALASRANLRIRVIEDNRPLYSYIGREVSVSQDDYDANPEKYEVFLSADHLKANNTKLAEGGAYTKDGKVAVIKSKEPVDYRTIVEMTRDVTVMHNKYFVRNGEVDTNIIVGTVPGTERLTERGVWYWSEAEAAGLTTKDNWKNFPGDCMFARAYMRVGRRIADDVFHGILHIVELDDAPDSAYEDITFEEVSGD